MPNPGPNSREPAGVGTCEALRANNGLYDRDVQRIDPPETLTVPPCTICGGTVAHATFQVKGVASPIVVCSGCDLGYYHPMLDPEQILSFYPREYYGGPSTKFRPFVERWVRFVARRHIAFLSRQLPAGARILDVGCGRGVLLGPLAELGFRVHGLEVSEDAVRGVDPRADIRIASHLAEAAYPDEYFDQVILWHVLEHLRDPRGSLEECHRILRPGRRLIVAVPNFTSFQARWSGAAWFHLDAPRHLYHFPLHALRSFVELSSFEVRSEHHFSLRQNPFAWIQSALNRYTRLPRNALYAHMYQGHTGSRPALETKKRIAMWSFFFLASPPALALSVATALFRSGATVHLVAIRK